MQSYYSFLGSPLHLLLEDQIADAYNRTTQAFFDAQKNHQKRTGSKWTPEQPLWMETNDEDKAAWKAVADVINLLIKINGGGLDIPEDQCTSDFLVKL